MTTVTITNVTLAEQSDKYYVLSGSLPGSTTTVHITVYKQQPEGHYNYYNKHSTVNQYVLLWGGSPDAYNSLKPWTCDEGCTTHVFDYDEHNPLSTDHFPVTPYSAHNETVSPPTIHTMTFSSWGAGVVLTPTKAAVVAQHLDGP